MRFPPHRRGQDRIRVHPFTSQAVAVASTVAVLMVSPPIVSSAVVDSTATHASVSVIDAFTSTANVTSTATTASVFVWKPTDVASCKLWLDPSRGLTAGTSWVDQVSSISFAQTGTHLAAGTGINGTPTVDFSSTDTHLDSATLGSSVISVSAWTALVVFRYTGAHAESGTTTPYGNPFIIGDAASTFWGATASTTKLDAYQYDGAYKTDQTTITTSTNYFAIIKYDGSKVFTSLNGGAFDAGVAAGNIQSLAHSIAVARNQTASVCFQGSIGDIVLFNATLSNTDITNLTNFAHARSGI